MRLTPQEFAAKRRGEQDDLISRLLPTVKKGLENQDWDDLIEHVKAEYAAAFAREGGEQVTRLTVLLAQVEKMLDHVKEPASGTAQSTATALAVAILNFSIMDAADDDPEPLVMEWVTMHDDAVRQTHREADGQQRPAGNKFTVGDVEMLGPGDLSAPIEEWINCRCVLAPALATMVAAISDKPWDGSASRFTPEEWKRSCVIHVCDGDEKTCHKLPIKEPNGDLSRAGVHAAAGRIGQVDAPSEKIGSAKRVLRGAYRQLGEDPPESLTAAVEGGTVSDQEDEVDDNTMAPLQWHGVLAPEGVWSGDRRKFAEGSLSFRDLPLPLKWQKFGDDAHKGDVVVGSIDKAERRGNMMHASGTFLATPEADELVGMVAHFGRFGVSVEADDFEMQMEESDDGMMPWTTFSMARVTCATAVPVPAYQEAWIVLGPETETVAAGLIIDSGDSVTRTAATWTNAALTFGRGPGWITNPEDTKRLHDYWTKPGHEGYEKIQWGVPGDFNRCRTLVGEKIAENSPEDVRFLNQICAQWHHDALGFWPGRAPTEQALETPEGKPAPALSMVASRGIIAPSLYFQNPELTRPTRLRVTEEGQVYGHIAEWGTCHVGFEGVCVEPPFSNTDYTYFLNGDVLTDQGTIAVGHITAGGGHAPDNLNYRKALAYYDSTSTVVADVTCGEDEHGIWVAGWVRPGATDEQVYALRASSPSGDWRNVHGNLELVIAHCVNSPGYPVTRSRVASGVQMSLVAAGVVKDTDDTPELMDRLAANLAEQVAAALEKRQQRRDKMAELATQIKGE